MRKSKRPDWIVNHKDSKDNMHSILVYREYCSWGNMGFRTVSEAKDFIDESFRVKAETVA